MTQWHLFLSVTWRGLFGEAPKSKAVPAIRSAAKMASMASRSPSWKPKYPHRTSFPNGFTMVYLLGVLTPLKGINWMLRWYDWYVVAKQVIYIYIYICVTCLLNPSCISHISFDCLADALAGSFSHFCCLHFPFLSHIFIFMLDAFCQNPCLLFSYYISLSVDALAEAFCGAVGSSARVFDMVGLPCICHHMSHVCYKLRKLSRGVLGTCPGLCWQNRNVCL